MKEYSTTSGAALPESAHEIIDFSLDLIIASRTNPRTTFDPAYLNELAVTIKPAGRVLQPILLRPLPSSRLEETAHMRPRPTHEIVFGECRYRSSKIAEMKTIRATVEHLTDAEVLVIQLIENLKRKDLSELEEAKGYSRMMDEADMSVDSIAKEIDKSRSYVFGRMKLLDLCSEARASLSDGTIDASRALVVARIPDHKLQIKAMKEIVAGHGYYGNGAKDPMSYREALLHIQNNYMLKLSDAKFKITSIELVPAAGSCKTCTKRTGHDPDLFSDVKGADVCTDPPCFHKKEEAHAATLVKEAKDKGQTVIAGKEAQELMTTGYNAKFKGYRRLDMAEDSPTDQPLRKIIGKQMQTEGISPVMIEHPQKKGELIATLPNEVVLRLLKTVEGQAQATKTVAKEVREFADEKKSKADAKAKERYEQDWRDQLVSRTFEVMQRSDDIVMAFNTEVHRYVALKTASNLSTEQSAKLAQLLGLGKVGTHSAVLDHIKTSEQPDMIHMLMIMVRDSSANDFSYSDRIANEGMHLVAGIVFGSELKATTKDIQAHSLAKFFPKVKEEKAVTTNAPAALAIASAGEVSKGQGVKGPAAPASVAPLRKRKLSAGEAQAAIAAAMQDQDTEPGAADASQGDEASPVPVSGFALPVGARVQIQAEYAGLSLTLQKWAEKKGVITAKDIPTDGSLFAKFDVTFRGRNGGVATFYAHQFKVLPS
jgi:ParB/RepB/Spo0J family partition protein